MSLISDVTDITKESVKASNGDPHALFLVSVFLGVGIVTLTIWQFLTKVRIDKITERQDRAKQSITNSFKEVAEKCEKKYEGLAKQEGRIDHIYSDLKDLEQSYMHHKTSTRFEFEALNKRMDDVENVLKKELAPDVNKIKTDIALIKGFIERSITTVK